MIDAVTVDEGTYQRAMGRQEDDLALLDPMTGEDPRPEVFTIDSEEKANWYLGKLHAIDSEIALVQGQAAEIVKRLQSQREQLDRQFGSNLQQYAKSLLTGTHKSVQFLYGTCSWRKVPRSAKVSDEQAAIDYVLSTQSVNADLVTFKTIKLLDKKAYVALMKEDGEKLPGIEITPERESFSIKFAEGE